MLSTGGLGTERRTPSPAQDTLASARWEPAAGTGLPALRLSHTVAMATLGWSWRLAPGLLLPSRLEEHLWWLFSLPLLTPLVSTFRCPGRGCVQAQGLRARPDSLW